MKETAIVVGPQIPCIEQLVTTLQADNMEIFWLQPEKEITSIPDPKEPTIVMLIVDEDAPDKEVLAQMQDWKKLFPLGYTMRLPLNNIESWDVGISQIRVLMKTTYRT